MKDHDWMRDATCRGTETNLFFGERGDAKTMRTAMEICNGTKDTPACPVRVECRDWAMSHADDNFGIFGGLTPSARLQLRRKRGREPKPVEEEAPLLNGRRMYRSGVPLRSELPDRPLPSEYEWRRGLKDLVRLIHEAVLDHENRERAKKGVGPIVFELEGR